MTSQITKPPLSACPTGKESSSDAQPNWYNLHIVLVVASRERIRSEDDFAELDRAVQVTAHKHNYKIAARAWMPDHVHIALRGNIDESPGEIAMSLMNDTAYVMDQNAIWQRGFYTGTFSEYDVRAVGEN